MASCFQEVYFNISSPSGSSSSDDSQRLVIVEESEDVDVVSLEQPAVEDKTKEARISYNFEEYKKICLQDYLLKKLTYIRLKRLMDLYHTEISQKSVQYRKRFLTAWKTAKAMSQTLIMFHLMFEEIKENITLSSIYYQRMSDLIAIYIDFEIKASENSSECLGALSSRVTYVMEKCLDHQHRFTLDTLLKTHNICNKFQEISSLLFSRVVRNLPSTQYSEQSFIRSMLVFKSWIQITKNADERTNIIKLASHLAKPPKELMEKPSELAKEILRCNFRKCYIDLVTYIIGTPWPLRKKIKIFLEHTRIVETHLVKEPVLKSSSTEQPKIEEMADVKALKEILSGLRNIIILGKKSKRTIKKLKNSHYKYAPVEELSGMTALSLEYLKINKNDACTQTPSEPNKEFRLFDSENNQGIYEVIKQMLDRANLESIQVRGREDILGRQHSIPVNIQHNKIPADITIDPPNNIRTAILPQDSIATEAKNVLNIDSNVDKKKILMSVSSESKNIQNSGSSLLYVRRNYNKNMEDEEASPMSERMSNRFNKVSSTVVANWHIPQEDPQPKGFYNPKFQPCRMQMSSGLINEEPTVTNQTYVVPSITSLLPLPQETPSSMNNEQPNTYAGSTRSIDSLPPVHSSNNHPEPIFTKVSPHALFNRQEVLKNCFMNDSVSGCMEDGYLFRKLIYNYTPSPLLKNNSNPYPQMHFNQVRGINPARYVRDCNNPMKQSYQMAFNQFCTRQNNPHDNIATTNSGPHITRNQTENKILTDPHFLLANNVGPHYPSPVNVHSGNNDQQPTHHSYQTKSGNEGSRKTSIAQTSHTKQSYDTPSNILVNTSINQTIPSWLKNNAQDISFRTLNLHQIPNRTSQFMPRSSIPNSNKIEIKRLPPYSSIRKKNNGFNPALPTTDSPSNSLLINPNPYYGLYNNMPIPLTVSTSQPPPVVNNLYSLPVMNTPSSLNSTNVSVRGPVMSTSTSIPIRGTTEINSEVMRSDNCCGPNSTNDLILPTSQVYRNKLMNAYQIAQNELTHKNDYGFQEYKIKEMPIPLHAFGDYLILIEETNNYITIKNNIVDVVAMLSRTNKNFVNKKNNIPPQLLKVNNYENKSKFNNAYFQTLHKETLKDDYLKSINQEKMLHVSSGFNHPSKNDLILLSDIQRCYCLQCCINVIVLSINIHIIFEYYNVYMQWLCTNRKSLTLKMADISKRCLEKSTDEVDSPLPLKKRITSTPPNEEVPSIKDSEISYPSTPMISIAQLEPLKDISENKAKHNTISINDNVSNTSSPIAISTVKSLSSEISKNISNYRPVAEAATAYHNLKCNESKLMPGNNSGGSVHIETDQKLLSSELTQSLMPIKLVVKNVTKKPSRRPRKNTKK